MSTEQDQPKEVPVEQIFGPNANTLLIYVWDYNPDEDLAYIPENLLDEQTVTLILKAEDHAENGEYDDSYTILQNISEESISDSNEVLSMTLWEWANRDLTCVCAQASFEIEYRKASERTDAQTIAQQNLWGERAENYYKTYMEYTLNKNQNEMASLTLMVSAICRLQSQSPLVTETKDKRALLENAEGYLLQGQEDMDDLSPWKTIFDNELAIVREAMLILHNESPILEENNNPQRLFDEAVYAADYIDTIPNTNEKKERLSFAYQQAAKASQIDKRENRSKYEVFLAKVAFRLSKYYEGDEKKQWLEAEYTHLENFIDIKDLQGEYDREYTEAVFNMIRATNELDREFYRSTKGSTELPIKLYPLQKKLVTALEKLGIPDERMYQNTLIHMVKSAGNLSKAALQTRDIQGNIHWLKEAYHAQDKLIKFQGKNVAYQTLIFLESNTYKLVKSTSGTSEAYTWSEANYKANKKILAFFKQNKSMITLSPKETHNKETQITSISTDSFSYSVDETIKAAVMLRKRSVDKKEQEQLTQEIFTIRGEAIQTMIDAEDIINEVHQRRLLVTDMQENRKFIPNRGIEWQVNYCEAQIAFGESLLRLAVHPKKSVQVDKNEILPEASDMFNKATTTIEYMYFTMIPNDPEIFDKITGLYNKLQEAEKTIQKIDDKALFQQLLLTISSLSEHMMATSSTTLPWEEIYQDTQEKLQELNL